VDKTSWHHWDEPGVARHIDSRWNAPGEILHRKRVLDKVAGFLEKDSTVLEVGCGSGRVYACLKDLVPVRYVGVDHSEEMVRLARESHPGIDFRSGDGYALDFDAGRFDAVLAVDVLQHVPDIAGIIREMVRVSRKYVFFTLSETAKNASGKEIILGHEFLWNHYTRPEALTKIDAASGGLPSEAHSVGACVLWMLRKDATR
jgi:ubiquinone/menaquinone biosynthesis C-methylase UbiE